MANRRLRNEAAAAALQSRSDAIVKSVSAPLTPSVVQAAERQPAERQQPAERAPLPAAHLPAAAGYPSPPHGHRQPEHPRAVETRPAGQLSAESQQEEAARWDAFKRSVADQSDAVARSERLRQTRHGQMSPHSVGRVGRAAAAEINHVDKVQRAAVSPPPRSFRRRLETASERGHLPPAHQWSAELRHSEAASTMSAQTAESRSPIPRRPLQRIASPSANDYSPGRDSNSSAGAAEAFVSPGMGRVLTAAVVVMQATVRGWLCRRACVRWLEHRLRAEADRIAAAQQDSLRLDVRAAEHRFGRCEEAGRRRRLTEVDTGFKQERHDSAVVARERVAERAAVVGRCMEDEAEDHHWRVMHQQRAVDAVV